MSVNFNLFILHNIISLDWRVNLMKHYGAENIKNIAIAGHAGSGKTSLAEALLFKAGASDRLGKTADGTTVCDYDPEEIKRKASSHGESLCFLVSPMLRQRTVHCLILVWEYQFAIFNSNKHSSVGWQCVQMLPI